ncbi:MAG: LysR family transcriptional regulator [Proteobacteria bacterium]|nr:LysR family transcriptional regulator [Pseudomonadota bacterium]
MDFTFEQLNAFRAVAARSSFSLAAETLFRTQSAVSIQVAKLEETVGRKLFHRTTKNVELTDAGRVLLRYVEEIGRLLEEAEQELMDLEKMERGRLTLSTSDTTACYRLPGILQAYRAKYPGIEIVVRNSTSLVTIEKVLQNEVDLGIATLSYLKPGLEAIPLFSRSDVMICHPDHPLAGRKEVFLKDLEGYACILLDRNCSSRRILDEICRDVKVELPIAMELSSIEVVKSFVSIDSGISIVPEVSIRKEKDSGQLSVSKIRDFQTHRPNKMGVIYKKNRYLSIAARRFLEELKEQLR